MSSNDPRADTVSLHRAAIDAAVAAGVGRILYTSHQGAALDTPFVAGRDHAVTEQLLNEFGVAWTSLRNGFYAHSLNWLMGPWRDTGVITVPADGPVQIRDDIRGLLAEMVHVKRHKEVRGQGRFVTGPVVRVRSRDCSS